MQVKAARTLFRDATTLPRIPRVQKSPHLRRVELVNVGTSVGCCGSLAGVKNLFDREAEGSRAERREAKLLVFLIIIIRARVCLCVRACLLQETSRGRRIRERHRWFAVVSATGRRSKCHGLSQPRATGSATSTAQRGTKHNKKYRWKKGGEERMRMVPRHRNCTTWERCSVAVAFYGARYNGRVESR